MAVTLDAVLRLRGNVRYKTTVANEAHLCTMCYFLLLLNFRLVNNPYWVLQTRIVAEFLCEYYGVT